MEYFQSQTTWEIPKAPVKKIIEGLTKEHTVDLGGRMPRWSATARDAIHEALESFIVEIFQDAVLVTLNRRRQTTSLEDVLTANLIKRIERPWPPLKDKKGKAKRKGKAGKNAKAHNSHHAKSTWRRR
jgi:histone H3/H4